MCRSCRQGALVPVTDEREFNPGGKRLVVCLLTSKCVRCGARTTLSAQHDENLRRLAARKPHYGELLMGEEIVRMRARFGLTQAMASKIFGKGTVAFSRYENETSFPDLAMTRLMTLAIEHPVTLKWLADRAGVEVPLWPERCEDAPEIMRMDAQAPHPTPRTGRARKVRSEKTSKAFSPRPALAA